MPTLWLRAMAAGAAYFGAVFAVGFALGVVRTLLVAPRVGPLWAVAMELPLMLAASWWVCTRLLRRWPQSPDKATLMGVSAFVLLMLAEAGLSLTLGGRSLSGHLALYAEWPHRLGLAGQLVFAALPRWQARRGDHGAAAPSTAASASKP